MTDTAFDPGIVLKITPPRLRKSLLARERLRAIRTADDVAVFLVEAPAGYGKTSLLSQWRLDWLQAGAVVAWVGLNADDTATAVASAIVESVRRATGNGTLGQHALESLRGGGTLPALTALLAEIAESAAPTVLVFDDCERVGDPDVLETLDYLLHNLPPNLQIAAGSRNAIALQTADLLAHGNLRRVTAAELRFDVPETLRLLTQRLGGRADADLCARLHEITEGWPLGLQLAAAALERSGDWERTLQKFSASREDTTRQLFEGMVGVLPPERAEFLTRCALLDDLHPTLCEALTGEEDTALWLQQLLRETPLLIAVDDSEWLRLHPLAREFLRARAQSTFSAAEREDLHGRAARWLAAHDFPVEAAQHALAAGDEDMAYRHLMARLASGFGFHSGFGLQRGRIALQFELCARIPAEVAARQPLLRVLKCWALVLNGQALEAIAEASRVASDPATEPTAKREAVVILLYAAWTADQLDIVHRYASACAADEPDSRLPRSVACMNTLLAIYEGATEAARQHQAGNPDDGKFVGVRMVGEFLIGLSYLWEGRPVQAEQAPRNYQLRFEALFGRRDVWVTFRATAIAAACWERDARDDARTLLANRLDIIGAWGALPDSMCCGYETLARMAVSDGDDGRAFALLEELAAIGSARGLLRCRVLSLAERIRLHAAGRRPQQCIALATELAALFDGPSPASPRLMPLLRLQLAMARTYVAFASGDAAGAAAHVKTAWALAKQINRGRETVQILVLRALLAARAGESPGAPLAEALSLAQAGGMVRVFADTLPEVVELIRHWADSGGAATTPIRSSFLDQVLAAASAPTAAPAPIGATPTGTLLTPKESEVLHLLAGGMPNKRIAATMGLSSETVKWHMKKVFTKLNAGNRQHAVDRARMLGLLA